MLARCRVKGISFIPGGNAKWSSHFGRQFDSAYKTKHRLKKLCAKKNPPTNI